MAKRLGSSFIRALVEVVPLVISSLLCSAFICTVVGLSFNYQEYPVVFYYILALILFAVFFLSIRVQDEAKDKIDCYMQAAVSGSFVGLLTCEVLREAGLMNGLFGNPFWEYKLAFCVSAIFWHSFIMMLLFKSLKNKKAASIRMQPRFESLD